VRLTLMSLSMQAVPHHRGCLSKWWRWHLLRSWAVRGGRVRRCYAIMVLALLWSFYGLSLTT